MILLRAICLVNLILNLDLSASDRGETLWPGQVFEEHLLPFWPTPADTRLRNSGCMRLRRCCPTWASGSTATTTTHWFSWATSSARAPTALGWSRLHASWAPFQCGATTMTRLWRHGTITNAVKSQHARSASGYTFRTAILSLLFLCER